MQDMEKIILQRKLEGGKIIKMGSYNLNAEEVADAMEQGDVEQHCEGDFYEETFIEGAKIYVERLRELGAYIYTDRKCKCKEKTKLTDCEQCNKCFGRKE